MSWEYKGADAEKGRDGEAGMSGGDNLARRSRVGPGPESPFAVVRISCPIHLRAFISDSAARFHGQDQSRFMVRIKCVDNTVALSYKSGCVLYV